MRIRMGALLSLLCVLLLSSCGTTLRKKNLEEIRQLSLYTGIAKHESRTDALVIVLLLSDADQAMYDYSVADPGGRFGFLVQPGDYRLFAYSDLDADFMWDAGEPWAMSDDLAVATDDPSGVPLNILTIGGPRDDAPPLDVNLALKELPTAEEIRTAALGRVVSMDDPMLGPEPGLQSLWQPIEFIKAKRAGFFFLEPYDPSKIAVVFINGIGGSPAEFRTIVSRLDRERFQPVFLAYPSGLPIELNSWLFKSLLVELRARNRNTTVGPSIVVAHSMGGLFARSMLNRAIGAGSRYPLAFISISTPWLGHDSSSEKGSQILGVPVWADLVPGSSFLESVFAEPLPEDLHYYLLFSYSGESTLVRGSDDGTVTIPSMLAYPAQDQARMIYGLAESHASILESEKTISLLLDILDREAERARVAPAD